MALTTKMKRAVCRETARRYQRAKKREKGEILDEFVLLTRYCRWYASRVLRNWGRRILVNPGGSRPVVFQSERNCSVRRRKSRTYGKKVLAALKQVWLICDCICGKRLAPYLPEIVSVLVRHGELTVDEATRKKLLRISAATVDRLLAEEKARYRLKGYARTKPGTLLLSQIPIRTFSDWDKQKPGFVEIDLVGHDGGSTRGEYAQTLDVTDVCTGWTETQAVKNKAQVWVFAALKDIRKRLPFPLLGIDSDNGSEFINDELLRYCQQEGLTFTRSRPYRKNDACFVEQKNYSVVRRAVGYHRYQTEWEVKLLNELYRSLRPYTDFFQPVMKLKEKVRIGSRVRKKHDKARTPYQRVLESPHVSKDDKKKLRRRYKQHNPAELKRTISRVQKRLQKEIERRRR